jgi:hypothetical protein
MSTPFDRRYQVFVSSTYEDLIEERKLIYETLLETYCMPVGMGLLPAAPEEKWKMICRLIEDCDYFIVIVAGKYGTLAPDNVGWTEKESTSPERVVASQSAFSTRTSIDFPERNWKQLTQVGNALPRFLFGKD